jgi:hypothetical protein
LDNLLQAGLAHPQGVGQVNQQSIFFDQHESIRQGNPHRQLHRQFHLFAIG